MRLNSQLFGQFRIPLLVVMGIIGYLILSGWHLSVLADVVVFVAIGIGSYKVVIESIRSIMRRDFVLDYIALLAIVAAVVSGEYLVGAIIALMITGGETLEEYGVAQAKRSLTKLINRLPDSVTLWVDNQIGEKIKVVAVAVGQEIFIHKGEVIPLDGVLVSEFGLTDESSLTGEPYEIDKLKGDVIRSGTVNTGQAMVIRVTKRAENSTYHQIVEMVKKAQNEKAPLVRLADKYSTIFTVITLVIAGVAFLDSHQFERILAVLVVATPCPLILATPIALIGGVNSAARKRIIVKKLAAVEVLSRVGIVIFDKTGTITLGVPEVVELKILVEDQPEPELLGIAASLERNSLHPLAKAIVVYAKLKKAQVEMPEQVEEVAGKGISGVVKNHHYLMTKALDDGGMQIQMLRDSKPVAIFSFEDVIKKESKDIVGHLKRLGYRLFIFTGDKKAAANKVVEDLGENIEVRAEMSPEDKQVGVEELQKSGQVVAMVGDGINDAPALALANVGLVFSNEEQTAASEAADVVFLGGEFSQVSQVLNISRQTVGVAYQSILWGIGLSIVAMVFASGGFIPPLYGAALQEGIDLAVIFNALRTSRI
jgi:heavy metal translocating P-type ATPase